MEGDGSAGWWVGACVWGVIILALYWLSNLHTLLFTTIIISLQYWTLDSGEVFSFPTEFCCVRTMLIAQQLKYSFLIIVCCAIIFALNTSHSLFLFKYSLGQNIPGYGWIKLAYSCWSNLLYWICFFLRFRERNSYK